MPETITEILNQNQLNKLRSSFRIEEGLAMAKAVVSMHPSALAWMESISENVYLNSSISPKEREIAVLSILAGSTDFPFRIHVYWAIASGLSPQQIGDVLLTAATYKGIDCLTTGIKCVNSTLHQLKRIIESSETPPTNVEVLKKPRRRMIVFVTNPKSSVVASPKGEAISKFIAGTVRLLRPSGSQRRTLHLLKVTFTKASIKFL